MPSATLIPCGTPGCKELVKSGCCKAHTTQRYREMDWTRGSTTQRGYDFRWRRLRDMVLATEPLCRDCQARGLITIAVDVHHIEKVKDRPELRLALENLMPVCRACHNVYTFRGD